MLVSRAEVVDGGEIVVVLESVEVGELSMRVDELMLGLLDGELADIVDVVEMEPLDSEVGSDMEVCTDVVCVNSCPLVVLEVVLELSDEDETVEVPITDDESATSCDTEFELEARVAAATVLEPTDVGTADFTLDVADRLTLCDCTVLPAEMLDVMLRDEDD